MFAVKKAELSGEGELPRGFVNVTAQKGRWVFSSLELVRWLRAPNLTLVPGPGIVSVEVLIAGGCAVAEEEECADERCAGGDSGRQ